VLGQRDQLGDWPVGIRRPSSVKGQGRPATDREIDTVYRPGTGMKERYTTVCRLVLSRRRKTRERFYLFPAYDSPVSNIRPEETLLCHRD
jgi:hypothetical protein